MEDERSRRRSGSQIITTEQSTKVVDVLNAVLPQIKDFVESMIVPPTVQPVLSTTTGMNGALSNGNGNGINGGGSSPAVSRGPVNGIIGVANGIHRDIEGDVSMT